MLGLISVFSDLRHFFRGIFLGCHLVVNLLAAIYTRCEHIVHAGRTHSACRAKLVHVLVYRWDKQFDLYYDTCEIKNIDILALLIR
jgi:hypothetical protein